MKQLFSWTTSLIITFLFFAVGTTSAQNSVLSWDFESNSIGDSLAHIGWSASDIQAVVANDPITSGNKVLENTIHNYNAAPVLKYVLPAGKTLADFSSFTFKGYFAQGDVGYKDIVVEAYQQKPTAQFTNNASAKIGSWNRAQMGSTSWENITVNIPTSSSLKDTIYIAFGISCAGTGNVGGTGVTTIWYADDVTLVAKPATSFLSLDFESNSIGDSLAHIGWSASDIQAVVSSDPIAGANKALKNTIHNYNAAPILKFVLPAGKTLADYSSFTFKGYFAQGDVGYKDVMVEAYQQKPTAQFGNNASAKIGSWNRAQMGSTSWENITVNIPNSSGLKDSIYIAFGISCAGTGNVGGTGVTTIWYADDVTLVPKPTVDSTKSVFAASKNLIDFGNVTGGTVSKASVNIYNRGTDTLKVTSISSTNTLFTFSPSIFTIAPSDSSVLTITFTPVDTSSQSGLIILAHNGARSADSISVKGKGLPRPSSIPLVTNGGFENSSTGVVSGTDVKGWLIQVAGGITPAPVFEIVSDTVQQGTRALKVTVHGLGTNQWDIQAVADSIPVKPGATYNYSIWAKALNPGAQVNFTMGTYAFTEYKAIRPATLTTQWQKFTMQFTVNDNQAFIRGPIHFSYAANADNSIYIDNLQIVDANAGKNPVVIEAESGRVGGNYQVLTAGGVTYVSPKTTWTSLTAPGDSSRMITYQVTFADSGFYNLFARVRVGPNGFDDDSFFYGNGFGAKKDTAGADWIFINGLATAGFADPAAYVDGPGTLGNSLWKWVNVTKNPYQGAKGNPFYVHPDSLTKTFQIGSREDGLDVDKLAFGKAYLYFTVANLDSVQAGSTSMQGPDTTTLFKGPPLVTTQGKFLGNAYGDVPDNVFAYYWTQLTPGNAGKWGTVAGSIDTNRWNWSGLDAQYNYAINNKMIFKDHNLIWGQQQPSWISGLDSATQAFYIETWIRMVGQRYPKIDMIDVVNEPLPGHNPPDGDGLPPRANYENALGGNGSTGWDWMINAFKLARKYLPKAKLLINEYGIINNNAATTSYVQIINLLKDRGLIDGIGVQGHRFELETADTNTLKSNLDKLAATGLPVYISEFDLGNLGNTGTPDDNQQLQLYQKIFPVLWRHPGVKGITLWGYLEGQEWQTTCYLVRADGSWRPALTWLAQFVKSNPTAVEKTISGLPSQYQLEQNFPNPFNPTTTIRYSIPQTSRVTLKVFDLLGKEIQTLVNDSQGPGQYTVTFNAQSLSSGIYFYRLTAGTFSEIKKLVLLK